MAKKGTVSKHSRAARRGYADSGEAKDLENVPRAQNTDVIGSMIRNSTSKNEELLRHKMERKQLQKAKSDLLAKASAASASGSGSSSGILKKTKKSSMISKAVRTKKRKFTNIDGRLSSKIEASINRAKDVQSTRKSGWELINKTAKDAVKKQQLGGLKGRRSASKNDDEMDEEDGWEDVSDADDEPKFEEKQNAFALLDEVEA